MDYQQIHQLADAAGNEAAQACQPVPMIVGSPSTPFGNDVDPNQRTYFVGGGVCGFAWIHIPDARSPFAKWAKDKSLGHKNYRKGYDIWVRVGGQSMQIKEAYARAYAGVLKANGIEAYCDSRMD